MSTATEDRNGQPQPEVLRDAEIGVFSRCTRCNLSYAPAKSTSALRLTYCSFLCELGDLGFSMAGLEHMERKPREESAPGESLPEPVAAR